VGTTNKNNEIEQKEKQKRNGKETKKSEANQL
jgi:hypothetical protein